MKWTLVIFLSLCFGRIYSQEMDTLKLLCNSKLTIVIPSNYKDTTHNYVEGYFRTFFWKNLDILDIQCGSLNEPIFVHDSIRFEVTKRCYTNRKTIFLGVEKETGKKWGVAWLKHHRIIVSYIVNSDRGFFFFELLKSL